MKIVVELVEDDKVKVDRVFLSFDKEGMEFLKDMLSGIHFKNEGDSVHMFSPDWGGNQLSTKPYFKDTVLVNHLELYYLGDNEESLVNITG